MEVDYSIKQSHTIICDPALENRSCVHITFDHIFRLWNVITLWLNIAYQSTFAKCAANNGLFNTSYGLYIACTGGEINRIMSRGVFCAHKPYFLMLGHI